MSKPKGKLKRIETKPSNERVQAVYTSKKTLGEMTSALTMLPRKTKRAVRVRAKSPPA